MEIRQGCRGKNWGNICSLTRSGGYTSQKIAIEPEERPGMVKSRWSKLAQPPGKGIVNHPFPGLGQVNPDIHVGAGIGATQDVLMGLEINGGAEDQQQGQARSHNSRPARNGGFSSFASE